MAKRSPWLNDNTNLGPWQAADAPDESMQRRDTYVDLRAFSAESPFPAGKDFEGRPLGSWKSSNVNPRSLSDDEFLARFAADFNN